MNQAVSAVKAGDIVPAAVAIEAKKFVDLTSPIPVPAFPPDDASDTPSEEDAHLQHEIRKEAEKKGILILVHNYQRRRIQELAHHLGDSLYLAQIGAASRTPTSLMVGVLFMAQTLALLKQPWQTILAPHLGALCSLAAFADAAKVRAWKADHKGGQVISYVNTYPDVKAESDYCCTSGNVGKVVEYVLDKHPKVPLLLLPDVYLGSMVARMMQKKGEPIDRLFLMMGACHVHDAIRPSMVALAREKDPDAAVATHPECGCITECIDEIESGGVPSSMLGISSTKGMGEFARNSPAQKIIMVTEADNEWALKGRVRKDQVIIPISREAKCAFMKQNTLQDVLDAVVKEQFVITVDPELAERARVPIERMLDIV